MTRWQANEIVRGVVPQTEAATRALTLLLGAGTGRGALGTGRGPEMIPGVETALQVADQRLSANDTGGREMR